MTATPTIVYAAAEADEEGAQSDIHRELMIDLDWKSQSFRNVVMEVAVGRSNVL